MKVKIKGKNLSDLLNQIVPMNNNMSTDENQKMMMGDFKKPMSKLGKALQSLDSFDNSNKDQNRRTNMLNMATE